MSTIVVFGVTGYAGGHITAELLDRGHAVIGVARDITTVAAREGLELRRGSLYDSAFRAEAVVGADAVAVALPAHPADGPDLETVVPGLLEAVAGARLGVVGGAASLQTAAGGPLVLDTLPEEYKPEAEAHARVLEGLRRSATTADWSRSTLSISRSEKAKCLSHQSTASGCTTRTPEAPGRWSSSAMATS
jgi:uncharacterized protein